ncbi:MAG: hypothetical protein M5U28_36330 [Sandaracinaceae bacterium]|nr:hypothetical protein [Sandaracinaceae bacterium]
MRTIAALLALAVSAGCDPAPDADAGVDASAPEDARVGEGTPTDTYFALAVTDDSRNHTGDRLLFLDFADRVRGTFDTTERGNRVVQAPFVEGTITVDGDDGDWDGVPVTRVDARPQSSYVLSEHYDAVPITIEVSAAYDDERVYLRARWEGSRPRRERAPSRGGPSTRRAGAGRRRRSRRPPWAPPTRAYRTPPTRSRASRIRIG